MRGHVASIMMFDRHSSHNTNISHLSGITANRRFEQSKRVLLHHKFHVRLQLLFHFFRVDLFKLNLELLDVLISKFPSQFSFVLRITIRILYIGFFI